MNKDLLIKKYQSQTEEPLFILEGDRVVVGEEVDENNQLHYVIRHGKNYTIESAWNQPIIERIRKPIIEEITVEFNAINPVKSKKIP